MMRKILVIPNLEIENVNEVKEPHPDEWHAVVEHIKDPSKRPNIANLMEDWSELNGAKIKKCKLQNNKIKQFLFLLSDGTQETSSKGGLTVKNARSVLTAINISEGIIPFAILDDDNYLCFIFETKASCYIGKVDYNPSTKDTAEII